MTWLHRIRVRLQLRKAIEHTRRQQYRGHDQDHRQQQRQRDARFAWQRRGSRRTRRRCSQQGVRCQ